MPSSVQSKMARGAGWMLLVALADKGIGLISVLILARLLAPADFGIVAMALSFIFMAQLLTAFGFDIALIQDQQATRAHYDTAWTFNVALGLTILLSMVAAANPIAAFYKQLLHRMLR